MKKYIVIMALVSGFAPWSMQAMNQMQIFAGQNQAAQAEQQADIMVKTSDEQQVRIPGNRVHYFETLQAVLKDADAADNSAIPLPPVSRATMQQLLADLQLIVNPLHAADTEDQAIVHAAAQSKITELSEQDFINARKAAQFLQSDLLLQLYDRDGITKAIAPILISDASIQALYDNNADYIQHILSMRSIFKNEIYQYIKQDTWLETNTLTRHTAEVRSAAFSPNGKKIVTASYDNTAKIWDALTGECLHALEGHTDRVWSAVFSPDGKKVATGSWDKTAKIWDASTGQCLHTLEGHTDRVWSAVFSPDGKKVATGSWDKTAKIWDALTGEFLHTLEGHTNWVCSAAFSPDGSKIVTASYDNTARIWQLFPAHNFDQALFARLLAWAQRNGHAAAWQAGWARRVMDTYSAEDQAKIKEMYPKPHQSIMQRISGYLSLLDA